MAENKINKLVKIYMDLAKERGLAASQHWHTFLLYWLTKIWKPQIVVDLGTYTGGSFYCFLAGIIEINNGGHVYTVDIEDRSVKLIPAKNETPNSFTFIQGDGKTVEIDKQIDFLFIDDDHSYEQVMAEWKHWEHRVNVGGLIFFHDVHLIEPWGKISGVCPAVKELWEKHKTRFIRLLDLGANENGDPCGLEIWFKISD